VHDAVQRTREVAQLDAHTEEGRVSVNYMDQVVRAPHTSPNSARAASSSAPSTYGAGTCPAAARRHCDARSAVRARPSAELCARGHITPTRKKQRQPTTSSAAQAFHDSRNMRITLQMRRAK
jgi:hypothetical protein